MRDDLRGRLRQAALELFHKGGYDRTTATEIAALAGVTERTFYRHFADKREVLFDGEAILRPLLTAAIADAPDGLGPLDTLFFAFRSILPMLEANRAYSEPRQEIISGTPALAERELSKHAALADALASALIERGMEDLPATLAARTGMMAFAHTTVAWLADPSQSLGDHLDLALRSLRTL